MFKVIICWWENPKEREQNKEWSIHEETDKKLADCFLQNYICDISTVFISSDKNYVLPENLIFKLMKLKHKRHLFPSCIAK